MAGNEEKAIINIQWDNSIDDKLKVSAGSDLEIIKNQVKNGIAQLWHCTWKNNEAYVVTRIEKLGVGYELCLVLGEGSGFFEFAPEFLKFAKRQNIGFRTHVKRAGLIRMWSKLCVNIDEYVLRG